MRVLWLKTELLHPIDKGGKIRTHATLRELKRDHHVTYLTLDDGTAAADAAERAEEYCHELDVVPHRVAPRGSAGFWTGLIANQVSSLPYALSRFRSPDMERRIVERLGSGDHDLVVCDFLVSDVNVPRSLPVPAVLFQHNVEAMIWKRHRDVRASPLARAFFGRQWRRMHRYEAAACRRYDLVIAVSPEDRDAMRSDYGVERVADVPTGVDIEFFRPAGSVERDPNEIAFVGSMDWLPNEDAVGWFAAEILPRVAERAPGVRFTVVGRRPSAGVRALADAEPRIELTGFVDDVRPYLERAAVAVVPLRIGGGTRLKIYESMAMECPTVSTRIGAEGLPLEHERDLLLADEPHAFADALIGLLQDPAAARELGLRGAKRVRRDFNWSTAARPFVEICEGVAAGAPAHSAGTTD